MPRTITLKVNEKATLEQLSKKLAQIAQHTGCLHCGFLGYEVRLIGDPDPDLTKFANGLKGGGINEAFSG